MHKILGLLAVVSFVYRYAVVYNRTGSLGFDSPEGSWFDWVTILLHMALSTSSLIFHVLLKRILSKPMVIWEEYRLHAIVFTLRCISVFAWGRLLLRHGATLEAISPLLAPALQCGLVLAHHLVVDEITVRYGQKDQTTVRVRADQGVVISVAMKFYCKWRETSLRGVLRTP